MSPQIGRLAQLVRALLSHGRGHEFKSRTAHHFKHLKMSDLQKPLICFQNIPHSGFLRIFTEIVFALCLFGTRSNQLRQPPGVFRISETMAHLQNFLKIFQLNS